MSNSCESHGTCGNVPCEPEVPSLLKHLVVVNCEARAAAMHIKEKLFGEERCCNAGCDPVDQSGYIGDLKRLARESEEVLSMLHAIAGAL